MYYIDNMDITKESFFKETELSASNFKGKGAKSELGGDKIVKILTVYPNLSPAWLLTGQGEPLISEKRKRNEKKSELPPGPCQQCEIREKLINQQEDSIKLLKEKIEDLKEQYRRNDKSDDDAYRQTG